MQTKELLKIDRLLPSGSEVGKLLKQGIKDLPTFPIVALKLLKLTNDEHTTIADLEKIIETDPSIMTRVLKMANSPVYALRHSVSSVRQAILLLGFSTIRSLALEVTIYDQFVLYSRHSKFDHLFYWRHCLSVAYLCKYIAMEVGYPDLEEAYIAGLLHDIGKIILDSHGRITYNNFLDAQPDSNGVLIEEERKIIGMGHNDIGAFFCHTWGFPTDVTLAVSLHHRRFGHLNLKPRESLFVSIVSLSNFITWSQGLGSVNLIRNPILQPEIEDIINFDKVDIFTLINKMEAEVKSIAGFYDFTFPSPKRIHENLLLANINISKMNTKYFYLCEELIQKMESVSLSGKSLTIPHQSLESKEILAGTLKAIHNDMSFDRLYVLIIDKNGNNRSAGYKRFEFRPLCLLR